VIVGEDGALRTRHRHAWIAYLGAVVALLGAYLAPVPEVVRTGLLGVAGIGAVVLTAAVVRRRRPRPARTWSLVPVCAGLFLVGGALRPWADGQPGLLAFAPDVFSLGGYLTFAIALGRMARAAGGLRREVVYDVLLAALTASAAAVQFLVLPVLELPGRSVPMSVVAAAYPLVDVVIVVMVLDLLLTAPRVVAHRWLGGAVACLLVGDVGYAVLGLQGLYVVPSAFDAPYLIAYFLLAVAVLHLPDPEETPATPVVSSFDAWSPARLVILGASSVGAAALVAIRSEGGWGGGGWGDRFTAFGLLCVLLGLVVARALTAVNGHAAAKAVLEHRATHDALTDLLGRDEFERRVDEELVRGHATGRRASAAAHLLFVDLDGFKLVNDTYGHVVGDELLCAVADRLLRLAPTRAVIGRLAGDEFVVAVAGESETAVDLARQLLGGLRTPVRLPVGEVGVSASIGIAEVTTTMAAALREADAAMYRAKSLGRNQFVVWDDSLRNEIGDEVEFELDLRGAVAEHSLEVHYQAIVSIASGAPRGVEALLRWTHPLHGPISPVEFVPVLEETGLIVDVGRFVLDTALGELRNWRDAGVVGDDFVVSVNVSPRQLLDPYFAETVRELLATHGVDGTSLLLEITESSMLQHDEQTLALLNSLRALGAGLAVDDFGTGYSALSYLRSFPVSRVKVDRSFVAGVGDHVGDEAVVRAVVAVSEALDLAVTAEGVETEQQRAVLQRLGVGHGQGWLWHKAQDSVRTAAYLSGFPVAHSVGPADRAPVQSTRG
jgi:diguanylate cyclase